MRKSSSSSSLLTLTGLFLVGSCSIIAEVDRSKIPQDAGTQPEGGQDTGGSGGRTGGTGGKGTSGAAGTGTSGTGTGGESGGGGDAGGGSGGDAGGGSGGDAGGGSGGAGDGGEGGMPAVCGNGTVETGEQCDDDDLADGNGCDSDCDIEAGFSCNTESPTICNEICGDGLVVGDEACDDHNNNDCGTCRMGCRMAVAPTAAVGSITPVAQPTDTNTFILNDGENPAVTFEFDSNSNITSGNVAIVFDGTSTADQVRDAIVTAVNAVGATLAITASNGTPAPEVTLLNDRMSSRGNGAIGGTNAGSYTKEDMAGGLAGDCADLTGCSPVSTSSTVCASGDCNSGNQCAN